ncbi:IS3 family transposase [Escherichia coli]|uniref:IS3 family transposase n=1 Tax=Escherichia coli TaxID=562 RepID=UPI000F4394BA|nr:IS3 family transposase [Escherichia coli]RNI57892.1 hypothetical protein EFV14_20730 [Escherichia coli]
MSKFSLEFKREVSENKYNKLHHLKQDIIDYIEYYNHHRIKEKLDGMSPVQYRLKHFS